MEFDDFDFDLSVLDDEQTSTKNSSEDDAKLKLLKQLLRSNRADFDEKLAELHSLLYGELLAILGEYDIHNIHQHHKLIKRILFEFATAMQTPTFAVISDDILSAYHEFSANDAKNTLTHLGVGNYLGTDQNEDFYSLFNKLVCYVGQSDSWQVNIVNRDGYATDISSVDSETLYSLFDDQRQDASRLHQLFTLQIGTPKWRYGSAIIKLIPVAHIEISNTIYTVTSQQMIKELDGFYSIEPDSTPNHPSTLIQAVINRLQAQVTQAENDCRQDISLLNNSLLNDDGLSDAASKSLNTVINLKKQHLIKMQNLSNSLPPLKSNLTVVVNQLIKIVRLTRVDSNLSNEMLWLSLLIDTNNLDELLDQVIGRFVDTYSSEDFDSISSMAEQGHARAQYSLGNCYHFAQGVEEDKIKAVEWYKKAAEQGHADAQFNLGNCYFYGQGINDNKFKAVEYFEKAAKQGHASALQTLHNHSITEGSNNSVEWHKKAAEQGQVNSEYYLGLCYEYGIGIKTDRVHAVKWYKKAAEQGHANAQYVLANRYPSEVNVKRNDNKTIEWYLSNAEQGDSAAQFYVGDCYFNGNGIEKNYKLAVIWYQKSAEQGNPEAQFSLGNCYQFSYGIKNDQSKAAAWYKKAAEQGCQNAIERLKSI